MFVQILIWTAVVVVMCYLFYVGQIIIHMCVHATLFRKRWPNEAVGHLLCSLQLVHFQGWRTAHMMHHLKTNTEQDPHRVDRPLVPYLLTHYFRIANAVWEPRRFLAAVLPPVSIAAGLVVWQLLSGHGARGLWWVGAFWLIPVAVSHLTVAHFNYITHVGLPPGRGHDTRNMDRGLWRLINKLTFNFYMHADHHLRPGHAIPAPQRATAMSNTAEQH